MGFCTEPQHFRTLRVWKVDRTDRLFALLSTFPALRSDSRLLVNQIRGSLDEMRELRDRLRRQVILEQPDGIQSPADLSQEYGLTHRESEVARLLAEGRSNAGIAQQLQISPHPARHHTQRILSKLRVHSRAAADAKLRLFCPNLDLFESCITLGCLSYP